MDWFVIIKDISLVAVGGVISIVTMLFLQWFNDRRKRKKIAKLILEDIIGQRSRLKILAELLNTKPTSTNFDLGKSRYDIPSYEPTVFKSLVGELSILPSECLEKVLGFYQVLSIFDAKLQGASKERTREAMESAFHGAERVFALGLEAEASIEEKVFSNISTAKAKLREAQKLRNK